MKDIDILELIKAVGVLLGGLGAMINALRKNEKPHIKRPSKRKK